MKPVPLSPWSGLQGRGLAGSLPALLLGSVLCPILVGCRPAVDRAAPSGAGDFSPQAEGGRLEFWANGEAFIREGLVSKDGWALTFDHAYVTLADITAYQTDPPFEAEGQAELQAQASVSFPGPVTVDLVTAPPAERAWLGSTEAAPGHYNALSWRMVPAADGPAKGYSLWLQGTARPVQDPPTPAWDGEIAFVLKLSSELTFTCGEYVGEERKGFVQAGQVADLEATFHFDHLFGDGSLPPEDSLNREALGFGPLLTNFQGQGSLEVDLASLAEEPAAASSPTELSSILEILSELGHVGEGHCRGAVGNP